MPHPTYPDLAGQLVLITGGATGIGAAHVEAFAATGARVRFLDIQNAEGEALARDNTGAGHDVAFIPCDLMNLPRLQAVIEGIGATDGPIFALVNNAAVDQRHQFPEITADDFDWMMRVNLRHVVFAAQHAAVQMRQAGRGAIVNTSSVAWMRGIGSLQLYSAAKAAIIGLTNSLARELGPDRIRVNAIAPGNVPTPRQHALWSTPERDAQMRALQCLPDPILPTDIANAAVFLCSDAARMITKQCLIVNAGSL